MRRIVVRVALIGAVALMLAACAADSHSVLPGFLRVQAGDPPPPEPPPDVKTLVRDQLDAVFIPASQPRGMRVSPPRRDLHGPGWSACVRAELTSAMGKPLGPQTYVITIEVGKIVDRRRVDDEDNCHSETYDPI